MFNMLTDGPRTVRVPMNIPLKFTFVDFIAGRGFLSRVEMVGCALLTDEDGEPWIHGVQPGCMAGGGPSVGDAFWLFREGYLTVLYDLANECPTFEDFRTRVHSLWETQNDPYLKEYEAALSTVTPNNIAALELQSLPHSSLNNRVTVANVVPGGLFPSGNALPSYFATFGDPGDI